MAYAIYIFIIARLWYMSIIIFFIIKKPSSKEIPQVTVNSLFYFVGAGAFTTINSNVSSSKFLTFIFVFTGIFSKVPLEYL